MGSPKEGLFVVYRDSHKFPLLVLFEGRESNKCKDATGSQYTPLLEIDWDSIFPLSIACSESKDGEAGSIPRKL